MNIKEKVNIKEKEVNTYMDKGSNHNGKDKERGSTNDESLPKTRNKRIKDNNGEIEDNLFPSRADM